jgi:hypothetical protein
MTALFPTQMFFQDGYLFYLADKKCKRVISRYQRQKDTESISLAGILIMIADLFIPYKERNELTQKANSYFNKYF